MPPNCYVGDNCFFSKVAIAIISSYYHVDRKIWKEHFLIARSRSGFPQEKDEEKN